VEDRKLGTKRRKHSAEFKLKVALEAVKEQRTISQLASDYNLHPNQISSWKKQLLSAGGSLFSRSNQRNEQAQAAQEAELYEQIGRLKMELEWLKKKAALFD
jgi:transposase-like protein